MGFTIISISISLVAVFIPIFFMPGVIGLLFHEFAIVVSLAILVSAFVSLTLVPMLASRFLKPRATSDDPVLALDRWFERVFDWMLRALRAHARLALRHRRSCCWSRAGTLVATIAAGRAHAQGLLPDGGHRPDLGERRGRRGHLVPGDGRTLQERVADVIRDDPAVATVAHRRAATEHQHRPHVRQPEAARRAPADEAGAREPAPRRARGPGHRTSTCTRSRTCSSAGASSKASYQYILQSVSAGELQRLGRQAAGAMRADPMFRDVTSDSQLKGLQAPLNIDRDKANTLGVSIERHPHRALQRLRRAPGLDDLHRRSTLPGDPGGAPTPTPDESAFSKIYVRGKSGALVPLSSVRDASSARSARPRSTTRASCRRSRCRSTSRPARRSATPSSKIEQFREQIGMPASIITSYGGDAAVFQARSAARCC